MLYILKLVTKTPLKHWNNSVPKYVNMINIHCAVLIHFLPKKTRNLHDAKKEYITEEYAFNLYPTGVSI
jgi:hypothetical protein